MKRILCIMLCLCMSLCVCLVACDDTDGDGTQNTTVADTTTGGTPENQTPSADNGIGEEEWNNMLSENNFENYTLLVEANMTTSQGGQIYGPNKSKSISKMTADNMQIILYTLDENGIESELAREILTGETADIQREQYSQIFIKILSAYENFTYDPETKTYKISELTVLDGTLKGLTFKGDVAQTIEVPCIIEIRNAEAVLSSDGKLLKLTCDYTQKMTMSGGEVTTFGITTWTLYDYGTTMIG